MLLRRLCILHIKKLLTIIALVKVAFKGKQSWASINQRARLGDDIKSFCVVITQRDKKLVPGARGKIDTLVG